MLVCRKMGGTAKAKAFVPICEVQSFLHYCRYKADSYGTGAFYYAPYAIWG